MTVSIMNHPLGGVVSVAINAGLKLGGGSGSKLETICHPATSQWHCGTVTMYTELKQCEVVGLGA